MKGIKKEKKRSKWPPDKESEVSEAQNESPGNETPGNIPNS